MSLDFISKFQISISYCSNFKVLILTTSLLEKYDFLVKRIPTNNSIQTFKFPITSTTKLDSPFVSTALLKKLPKLRAFYLSNLSHSYALSQILNSVKTHPWIEYLDLRENELQEVGSLVLEEVLIANRLKVLKFRTEYLQVKSYQDLANGLSKNKSLKKIKWRFYCRDAKCYNIIGEGIKRNTSLCHVNLLTKSYLTNENISNVAEFLQRSEKICVFKFTTRELSFFGCELLSKALSNSPVQKLKLDFSSLSVKSTVALTEFLKTIPCLVNFHLFLCNVTDGKHPGSVGKMLNYCSSLNSLKVILNHEDIKEFQEFLKKNSGLKILRILNMYAQDLDLDEEQVFRTLVETDTIEELEIDGSCALPRNYAAMSTYLEKTKSLKKFSIKTVMPFLYQENAIEDYLAKGLFHNTSIECLKLPKVLQTATLTLNALGTELVINESPQIRNLRIIDLSLNHFENIQTQLLVCQLISINKNLHTVELESCRLTDIFCYSIVNVFPRNPSLSKLNLKGNNFNLNGLMVLCKALSKQRTKISYLNLSENTFQNTYRFIISSILEQIKMGSIRIRHPNYLPKKSHYLSIVFLSLGSKKGLRKLQKLQNAFKKYVVKYGILGFDDIIYMKRTLFNLPQFVGPNINEIDLSQNKLGPYLSYKFLNALAESAESAELREEVKAGEGFGLKRLNFLGNQCKLKGAIGIAKLLHNSQIEILNISYNRIGIKGVKIISQAMKSNSTLKELQMGGNFIQTEGFNLICQVLLENQNSVLMKLDVNSCNISDDGLIPLIEVVKAKKMIRHLNLMKNSFNDDPIKAFILECKKMEDNVKNSQISFSKKSFLTLRSFAESLNFGKIFQFKV